MFQYRPRLLEGHAREPLDELRDLGTVLQVFEQRRNGYPGATEDPGAAYSQWFPLGSGASGPINHEARIAPEGDLE